MGIIPFCRAKKATIYVGMDNEIFLIFRESPSVCFLQKIPATKMNSIGFVPDIMIKIGVIKPDKGQIVAAPVESVPDLEDEDTTADDLPLNRWLDLAAELAGEGKLRLALRAFYLATLAGLAEHGLITIEKFKSNREYEIELRRRAHQKAKLLTDFTTSREVFERVWYGLYTIKQPQLDDFAALQKRMITLAQS